MFSVVVSLRVQPQMRERFLEAITANAQASVRDKPGCLRFDVCEDVDEPDHFMFYEVYRDEDAFAAHRTMPHFAAWREAAAVCLVPDSQVNTRTNLLHSNTAPEV